ncbi:MAG: SDR family NAD(P)-dependent oxidoreductase [Alphaproteobacteria bacterium]|nr:SDR family NAD(P)-dependent oxidoreductase [Alphaproteobacteria bacterium]
MKNPRSILITGASSGIGEALALHYAAPGITLFLHGRDSARLSAVAQSCQQKGAVANTHTGNVADAETLSEWIKACDAATPLELVIANAGVSAGSGQLGETAAQVRELFAVNIGGVVNTVHPALAGMVARGRGQVALIASLAGMRGLPSSPAYSASKACVRVYGEGLRGWLAGKGVEVNVVCPGYVRTRMTAVNDFPMPFIMNADKAARIIARGLQKNRSRIAFPLALFTPLWLLSCLSPSLTDWFFARLPAKPSLHSN